MWLKRIAQVNAESIRDEFARRMRLAWQSEREIRGTPRKAQSYFDSIVEDTQIDRLVMQPWQELRAWMESILPQVQQSNDTAFVESFTNDLKRLQERTSKVIDEPNPADYENWFDEEVAEFYLDNENWPALQQLLDANNVPYDIETAPTGKQVIAIEMGDDVWVIEPHDNGLNYWKETWEWIDSAAERPEEFYGEQNRSEDFWRDVGQGFYLYHATPTENVEPILQHGLEAREMTRGLSNTDMGAAVFTISDENIDDLYSVLGSYGDSIIRIDVGAMKADGFMPEVSQETPVAEADIKNSLAHLIGYSDRYDARADQSDDMWDDTIAIYSDIPPKYLSLMD